jgi:hypothetical protein
MNPEAALEQRGSIALQLSPIAHMLPMLLDTCSEEPVQDCKCK